MGQLGEATGRPGEVEPQVRCPVQPPLSGQVQRDPGPPLVRELKLHGSAGLLTDALAIVAKASPKPGDVVAGPGLGSLVGVHGGMVAEAEAARIAQ